MERWRKKLRKLQRIQCFRLLRRAMEGPEAFMGNEVDSISPMELRCIVRNFSLPIFHLCRRSKVIGRRTKADTGMVTHQPHFSSESQVQNFQFHSTPKVRVSCSLQVALWNRFGGPVSQTLRNLTFILAGHRTPFSDGETLTLHWWLLTTLTWFSQQPGIVSHYAP